MNLPAITVTIRHNLKFVLSLHSLSLCFAVPVEEARKFRGQRQLSWQGNLVRNILPPSSELLHDLEMFTMQQFRICETNGEAAGVLPAR